MARSRPPGTATAGDAVRFADRIRLRAVRMVAAHGFGYLGQALSSAELLAALYLGPYRPEVDDLVCSPGHYVIGLFAAGVEVGLLDEAQLATYGHDGSQLEAIGTERSPAMDLTGGSLGQGLSGAVGFALSHRLRGQGEGERQRAGGRGPEGEGERQRAGGRGPEGEARVFALVSDGELEEGQLWEAAMFAGHHALANLVVLLDANDSQVDGPVSSITSIEPIVDKWRSFGWDAVDVDGHDVRAVGDALDAAVAADRPAVVVGRTSTVHGLDALPADADGHFIKLSAELADAAVAELEARLA